MRFENKEAAQQERLAPEDLDAIRERLADPEGRLPDLRAHGAVTQSDVADALGVPLAEVQRQVDLIRQDRALHPTAPPRPNQRGLLALAVVLFVTAFGIYRLTPHKMSEAEIDAMADQVRNDRLRRMKKRTVSYPIETQVASGARPPAAWQITLQGELTKTTSIPERDARYLDAQGSKEALTEALLNAYEVACKAEASAPIPSKPLRPVNPSPMGQMPTKGSLVYTINGGNSSTSGTVAIPSGGVTSTPTKEDVRAMFAAVAEGLVNVSVTAEKKSLELEKESPGGFVQPPAGYTVTFTGRISRSLGSTPLSVLPVDQEKIRIKLESIIHMLVRKDFEELPGVYPAGPNSKAPVLPFSNVTIRGPLSTVEFKTPVTAGPGYPTAADAARAADRIIREQVRIAAAQIGRLNEQVKGSKQ